jgi:hypothetical protein
MSSKRPPPKPERAPESTGIPKTVRAGSFELPPVPKMPNVPDRFNSEPPTREKNVTASVYQSLISVFDEMTPAQRMEFVDVAAMYSALDASARRAFFELLALYPQLWAADRIALHELAERLATSSGKQK